MGDSVFRWGIVGLGNIAHSFAWGLRDAPGAQLVAGASRSSERAEAFKREFNVPRCYPTYEELFADPEVDAIYIATRHPDHACAALAAIEAGKPVLVEKPFTVNVTEAKQIVQAARERRVFCMEAMWTRFLPLMGKVRELVAEGAIGDVRLVQADFSFASEFDPTSRIFDPALGGGALLDVGVYPISFASMLLGRPTEAVGTAHLGASSVDENAAMSLLYNEGRVASLACGTRARSHQEAVVVGTTGRIRIHSPWFMARTLTLTRESREDEVIERAFRGNGYCHEAEELMSGVRAGRIESPVLPLDETIDIMRTMDTLRRQWGLRYTADEKP
jgi:predicted dehydrogenase